MANSDLLAGGEMCQAAFCGNVDLLRRILEFGAAPNSCDYDRRTAAHLACAEGMVDVAVLLMEVRELKSPFTVVGMTNLFNQGLNQSAAVGTRNVEKRLKRRLRD